MRRTDVHEVGTQSHGGCVVVMGIHREPTHQLVVARLRYLVHGGRTVMDVHPQALVVLAGISAQQPRICLRNDCGHVRLP